MSDIEKVAIVGLKALNAYSLLQEIAVESGMTFEELVMGLDRMKQGDLQPEKFVSDLKITRDQTTKQL